MARTAPSTERLHIVPAQLQVIVTVRPKYACRKCEEGVTQAPAPAHLIEGALPTEGMLAHVMVSKVADHLPLYRQAQIYARSGVDLHRSTLALWVGKGSFEPRPVYECLKGELKRSNHLGLDETTVRVLAPGRGKTKTGYCRCPGATPRAVEETRGSPALRERRSGRGCGDSVGRAG